MSDQPLNPSKTLCDDTEGLAVVMESLKGLRFGSVEITVHEGRMVHIERKERFRVRVSAHLPGSLRKARQPLTDP